MNEFRVKVTVRNNLILSAIEAAGYTGWGSISRFCEHAGMNAGQLNSLVSMRDAPIRQDGEFSAAAKLLMEALGACPSDLWTEEQLTMELVRNAAESTVSSAGLQELLAEHTETMTLPSPEDAVHLAQSSRIASEVLGVLPSKQQQVVRMRMGFGCEEMTYKEIGEVIGLTQERVRQIEAQALRRLKHPSMHDRLRQMDPA